MLVVVGQICLWERGVHVSHSGHLFSQSELSGPEKPRLFFPVRWGFSNLFVCHVYIDGMDFFPPSSPSLSLSLSPPALTHRNCNFKTVCRKYRYCGRHNQTFMRERDLGRGRESRSWMCSLRLTAAVLSTPFSPSKPSLCPLLLSPSSRLSPLSFVFLFLLSHLSSLRSSSIPYGWTRTCTFLTVKPE